MVIKTFISPPLLRIHTADESLLISEGFSVRFPHPNSEDVYHAIPARREENSTL